VDEQSGGDLSDVIWQGCNYDRRDTRLLKISLIRNTIPLASSSHVEIFCMADSRLLVLVVALLSKTAVRETISSSGTDIFCYDYSVVTVYPSSLG
jgi:hypothetical protein